MLIANATGRTSFSFGGFDTEEHQLPILDPTLKEQCFGLGTQVFVQMACSFDIKQIQNRKEQGLFISCCTVGIALFIMVWIEYIRNIAKTDFVEWDVKTITAGDYTVEFDIGMDFYEKF